MSRIMLRFEVDGIKVALTLLELDGIGVTGPITG